MPLSEVAESRCLVEAGMEDRCAVSFPSRPDEHSNVSIPVRVPRYRLRTCLSSREIFFREKKVNRVVPRNIRP